MHIDSLTLRKSHDYCTIIISILRINKLRNREADLPKVTRSKWQNQDSNPDILFLLPIFLEHSYPIPYILLPFPNILSPHRSGSQT